MADTATLVYDIDSRAARTAASDLAKLNDASARAAGGADKLNKTLRDSQGRFRSSYDVAKQYGSEIRGLAAKYNPALNAVYQYQQAQTELNRAVALGVLTQGQADAALERTAMQMQQVAAGTRQAGNAQASVGNQFAQLNDVVVTAWGGMNPALIGMQQGMQMVQGFAGQSVPQALGTLKGAFTQLLNPTTLLTVGLVAGAAALIQLGTSVLMAEKEVRTLDEVMGDLGSSTSSLVKANDAVRVSVVDLISEYGLLAGAARGALENQVLYEQAKAQRELLDAVKANIDAVAVLREYSVDGSLFGSTEYILGLKEAYGLTQQQVVLVNQALRDLSSAQSNIQKVAAAQSLSKELLASYGHVSKMPPEMQELFGNAQKVITSIGQAEGATNSWAGAMSSVLSYIDAIRGSLNSISGGGIQLAAIKTETDLLRQGKTLREASLAASVKTAELEGDKRTSQLEAQYGWAGKILGIAEKNQQLAIIGAEEQLNIEREIARNREKENGGGSGGGAAIAQAEKQFQSLRELLQEDTMFQYAEYEKRSAQLDNAKSKDLLTEQQYQEMKRQLQILYFGLDYERNAVNYQLSLDQLKLAREQELLTEEQFLIRRAGMQWDYTNRALDLDSTVLGAHLNGISEYFGNANSIAGGGYDKLLKAQQTFAAASALISAYKGAADALATPGLTPWQKIAEAGKVLAAGMGFVSAIKGGGTGSGGASSAASAAATKSEPIKTSIVRLEGDDWLVSMADTIMTQIYDASRDGRVIIKRGND